MTTTLSPVPLKDAGKCRAKNPSTCRYHGSLLRMLNALRTGDYVGYEQAKQEFLLAEQENNTKIAGKPATQITEKPANTEDTVGDTISASVSRQYGHYSIIEDHMHNGSEVGSLQEIIYYSTPQGKLELKRRANSPYNKDYLEIMETIKENEKNGVNPRFNLNENAIANLAEQGKKDWENLTVDPVASANTRDRNAETDAIRHHLVEESHKWLSNLTTKQQEAISWLTSNGFGVAQYAVDVENPEHGAYSFEGIVDSQAIRKKHGRKRDVAEAEIAALKKDYAVKYLRTVRSAFKKAPKFDKPMTIVRGSTVHEMKDIVGDSSSSYSEIMDRIEAGYYKDKPINPNARMRKLPLSASASPSRALNFADRLWHGSEGEDLGESRELLIVIKAKTSASPVNVGAWGTAEFEVLTNPLAKYNITGGRRVNDDQFVIELTEV